MRSIIETQESMSSFEFGKTGKRFKIYFWTTEELILKLERIRTLKKTELFKEVLE